MKEGTGTAPTDTVETMQSPVAAELAIAWPFIAEPSHPSRRIQSELWSAGRKKIPSFVGSPWDFYEPFLKLSSRTSLVLCNDRSTLRVIQSCGANEREGTSTDESLDGLSLLEIRHKNFVNIYELYLFSGEISAVNEHVGFSIEDLLQKSICFSEPEISYIISQVRQALFLFHPTDIAGFDRDTFYLVKETRSPAYIRTKYSGVSKRRGQDR